MGETVLSERWFQLGQRLGSDAVTDAVIPVNNDLGLVLRLGIDELDSDGEDLFLEFALFLSSSGLVERLGGELILNLTSDAKILGDVLRGYSHGKQTFLGLGHGEDLL